jgi:hypothetical protein
VLLTMRTMAAAVAVVTDGLVGSVNGAKKSFYHF